MIDGIDVKTGLKEIPCHFAEFFARLRITVQDHDRTRGGRLLIQFGVKRIAVGKRHGKLFAQGGELRLDDVFHRLAIMSFGNQAEHSKKPPAGW